MSSVGHSHRNEEQRADESTVEIVPPYAKEIESFGNEDAHADLKLVVEGMENPLKVHKWILARASRRLDEVLRASKDAQLEWPYDTKEEVDRKVLVKALRFCYGETQTVGIKKGECCAMIAVLTRLQVTCLDAAVGLLTNFAVEEATRNLETGVELLKACTRYSECCGSSTFSLNKQLAAIVLTKENMQGHYKEIVDECLMVLPPDYLLLAEFGEPHTRCSEFCLRTKYLRYHPEMSTEDKQAMMVNCDWSTLNSYELRELRLMDTIDKDELLVAYEKALEYSEIENEQANDTVRMVKRRMEEKTKKVEKEKEKESERAMKAECEAEEQRGRAERAENEKKKYLSQVETLSILVQRNGLHTCSPQSE